MPELTYDTLILGAGAAGMMCAIHAAARGGRVLIIDHARKPGEKIRISGGGRCNFTNIHTSPSNFLSNNPHFAKSALKRFTQHDFVDLVQKHGIGFHEKTLGQLFCDTSATDIINMLLTEMSRAGVELQLETDVSTISKTESGFAADLSMRGLAVSVACRSFVVACGGKSIPKMGATGFGYRIAEQFGLPVTETRAALVPLTFSATVMEEFRPLAGVSVDAEVSCGRVSFREGLLFTHRGLSGPSILQISSYWRETEPISINLLPQADVLGDLKAMRDTHARKDVATVLGTFLPNRLADYIVRQTNSSGRLADLSDETLMAISGAMQQWQIHPVGTEGYRTAEVTLGGVDTHGLSSRSMQARHVPGLYFIGEVVDVTGWLGGYNFQWAWSSGWAAGKAISEAGNE